MRQPRKASSAAIATLGVFLSVVWGCGSGVQGTYTDAAGSVLLELRSGGQASITFMGEIVPCTYKVDTNKVALNCKEPAGIIQLSIHDDGSLTGPPGSFFPVLRKTK